MLVRQPGADNKTLATTLHIGEHTLRNHYRLGLYVCAQRHGVQQQF